jgi:lipopolysaccharide export system permease protein
MFLTTIWERYFLKETIKVFCLFLLSFYLLYVLIDYSTHAASFKHHHFGMVDILRFYGYEFISRMDVLVPFALLITTIKTLCTLNTRNELVALMSSGIKLKRLLFPFIAFGLLFTSLIYLNTEIVHPFAMQYHKQLDHSRAKKKEKKYHEVAIQQLILNDNSSLLFQKYDEFSNSFFDAYWIRSIDDIYRIQHLFPDTLPPTGMHIEHLMRDPQGNLLIAESVDEMQFPKMRIDKTKLMEALITPSELAISTLKTKLPKKASVYSDKEARVLTTYHHKVALPWVCLLAVLAPAPFCTRYNRTLPVFFIYATAIFGLVAFFLIMDSAVILGERQILHPAAAIWTPFVISAVFFGWKFYRL